MQTLSGQPLINRNGIGVGILGSQPQHAPNGMDLGDRTSGEWVGFG